MFGSNDTTYIAPPPPPIRRRYSRWYVILIVVVISMLIGGGFLLYVLSRVHRPINTTNSCNIAPITTQTHEKGLGATPGDHACMGISDGTATAFDLDPTGRPASYVNLKRQIIQDLARGEYTAANKLWTTSPAEVTNDAETWIYLQNQYIIQNHQPYVTLIVTTLFPSNTGGSRDLLQGAYVLQKEAQTTCIAYGCPQLRLLIANAGSSPNDAITVSQQIRQAAHADLTIQGVIGWSLSQYALQAMSIPTGLPMISPTVSADSLSSPDFFRIAPTNSRQASVAALYVQKHHYQHIVVFSDLTDSYSQNLAQDFAQDDSSVIDQVYYTKNNAVSINKAWSKAQQDAKARHESPDLIYFAGYAPDVSTLLGILPRCLPTSCLDVLGGDALYVVGDYSHAGSINYNRLRFTAFAYPDEWGYAGLSNPHFFDYYRNDFDPYSAHSRGSYSWERPDADVMLSYDAVSVAMYAYSRMEEGDAHTLQQALGQISGSHACMGVTGRIDFRQESIPKKAVIMLTVDAKGRTQIAPDIDQSYQSQLNTQTPACSIYLP